MQEDEKKIGHARGDELLAGAQRYSFDAHQVALVRWNTQDNMHSSDATRKTTSIRPMHHTQQVALVRCNTQDNIHSSDATRKTTSIRPMHHTQQDALVRCNTQDNMHSSDATLIPGCEVQHAAPMSSGEAMRVEEEGGGVHAIGEQERCGASGSFGSKREQLKTF